MKNKPHPKSLNRKPTVTRPGLLSPEREEGYSLNQRHTEAAAPLPPLHALILEKLGQVQRTEGAMDSARAETKAREAEKQEAERRLTGAHAASSSAYGKFEAAVRDLGEVLKGMPDQPVKFAGSLWIYTTGSGLRRYSDSPLVLGLQS